MSGSPPAYVRAKEKSVHQPNLADADRDAWEYMRKNGRYMEVEPPRRMTTRSQTRGPEAGYSAYANDHIMIYDCLQNSSLEA
jgi:hypothetical protein